MRLTKSGGPVSIEIFGNLDLSTAQLTRCPHSSRTMTTERKDKLTLHLPDGEFHAYLFDCDGTIADSMPLHYVAWRDALAEWNCRFSEELFYAWAGLPVAKIIFLLNEEHGLNMPVEEAARRKEEFYLKALPNLKAVPEVLEHIELQYGRIPLAVVSGSTRESVSASLRSLHLLDRFETLVCAGDYKEGKPHPEAFLTAATRLNVKPESCLVFEDGELGIVAAKAAGMAAVRVSSPRAKLS